MHLDDLIELVGGPRDGERIKRPSSPTHLVPQVERRNPASVFLSTEIPAEPDPVVLHLYVARDPYHYEYVPRK